MRLILNGINGEYLRDIIESAAPDTESVDAAVAYATDSSLLFDWCWKKNIPLRFWGRFDDGVPVSVPILKSFLDRRSPNFACYLIRHLHAKVIRWRGVGAYIGSANLSSRAWYNNVEAGYFMTEAELVSNGHDLEIDELFRTVHRNAVPLTQELFESIERRNRQLSAANQRERDDASAFSSNPNVPQWGGLVTRSTKSASEARKASFLREWNETLQIIRNLASAISSDEKRPGWIRNKTPLGAQADQFLHAHYYERTFEHRHAMYEAHFQANRNNPGGAVDSAIEWWSKLNGPPSSESVTLNDWAPLLKDLLSEENLSRLDEGGLIEIFMRIHAIRDHARRVANKVLGLPDGKPYSIDEKAIALARYAYRARSGNGQTISQLLQYVLYGGSQDELPERLWDAVTNPDLKIDHFGLSALGELVGWALPDRFPPRNGRTSKALRSLGFDVSVHV
jgi:hypothetical protein